MFLMGEVGREKKQQRKEGKDRKDRMLKFQGNYSRSGKEGEGNKNKKESRNHFVNTAGCEVGL